METREHCRHQATNTHELCVYSFLRSSLQTATSGTYAVSGSPRGAPFAFRIRRHRMQSGPRPGPGPPRRTDLPGGPGINPVCPVSSESIFATPRLATSTIY
eukprot:COSAG06_NODE_18036_length_907_cov_2.750000_1_plen_100_part_01